MEHSNKPIYKTNHTPNSRVFSLSISINAKLQYPEQLIEIGISSALMLACDDAPVLIHAEVMVPWNLLHLRVSISKIRLHISVTKKICMTAKKIFLFCFTLVYFNFIPQRTANIHCTYDKFTIWKAISNKYDELLYYLSFETEKNRTCGGNKSLLKET